MPIEPLKPDEEVLKRRLVFEEMLSDLSARVMTSTADRIDGEIHFALERIREFFQVDRCGLLEISKDQVFARTTHIAYGPGAPQVPREVNLAELFPWCYSQLMQGRHINIFRVEDYPEDAIRDRQSHAALGITSALNLPVAIDGKISRTIVINCTRRHQPWPEEYIPRLRLLGEILVNALERSEDRIKLEEQLRFERLLVEISGRFINLPADQIDNNIEDAQRRICEFLDLDRSTLWQVSEENPEAILLKYFYFPPGNRQRLVGMNAKEFFPWSTLKILNGETVILYKMADLPAEAGLDQENFLIYGTQSTAMFPMSSGEGPVFGMLAFAVTRHERRWSDTALMGFKLLAQVFANALIRKQAETELRESEARLSLTTEAVGAGLWIMDLDTQKVWVSPQSRALFNFPPDEEIHYDSYFKVIHPEDRVRVAQEVHRALLSGEELQSEYRILLPDGALRWIASRGKLILKTTKESARLMGLSLDITNRKVMEESLRASDEINRATFELAAVGLAHVGINGQWLRMNDKLCAIVGYERDELMKMTFQEITHPEDLEKDLSLVGQLLDGKIGSYAMEKRYLRKDCSIVWVNLTVSLVHTRASEPVHFISVVEDITARVEAQASLSRIQKQNQLILNSTAQGILGLDLKGNHTFVNPAAAWMLGYEVDELIGRHSHSTWHHTRPDGSPYPEELCKIYATCIDGKEHRESSEVFWRKDGTCFAVEYASRPIRDEGHLVGAVLTFEDITERHRAEETLRLALDQVQQLRDQLQSENVYLREQVRSESGHGAIVGESAPIQKMLALVRKVAPMDSAVLITGETGTGKELLAQAIHDQSARKNKMMVKVNCAAIPAPLIESELFGREKGAYTGAMTQQVGRFQVADGSTIFLDEIGDLPLDLQAKLLRVLQDGCYERLGSHRSLKTDVRVIAATNRDLAAMMKDGKFREDLFHRLNVFPIEAPPLRARIADIPLLVWKFVQEFNLKMGRTIDSISKPTMERLKQYAWPGNVRELRNVIERAMIIGDGRSLKIELPELSFSSTSLPVTIEELERKHIIDLLERTHWRISGKGGAAELLGLVPTTLHSRMKKLGISRPER